MDKLYADSLTLDEMREYFVSINEKPFRAEQLYRWVHAAQAKTLDEMTNLSKDLRRNLADKIEFTVMEPVNVQESKIDGSIKVLFKLEDGNFIESVMLKDADRMTGCISSQIGCRMGCRYCCTASMGLVRNLTVGEIVGQVAGLNKIAGKRLTNLVFMGMGEPLDNLPTLKKALTILFDDKAYNFSHNKVTVSTCGLADKLPELLDMDNQVNIAVSLNAVTDEKRSSFMPINNKFPLKKLMDCLNNLTITKRKRITIEYILFKGINDSLKDAEALVKLLGKLKVKINLIGYNYGSEGEFEASSHAQMVKFQEFLVNKNYTTFIRKSLGADIDGACGQLCVRETGSKES